MNPVHPCKFGREWGTWQSLVGNDCKGNKLGYELGIRTPITLHRQIDSARLTFSGFAARNGRTASTEALSNVTVSERTRSNNSPLVRLSQSRHKFSSGDQITAFAI